MEDLVAAFDDMMTHRKFRALDFTLPRATVFRRGARTNLLSCAKVMYFHIPTTTSHLIAQVHIPPYWRIDNTSLAMHIQFDIGLPALCSSLHHHRW